LARPVSQGLNEIFLMVTRQAQIVAAFGVADRRPTNIVPMTSLLGTSGCACFISKSEV
jgi:hypothetical protein